MKNKNIYFLSTVLLVLCLGLGACDEECFDATDPLCENYDPCWDWVEPSFEMGNVLARPSETTRFKGDTVLYNRSVYFKANVPNATEYTWQIGTDSRTWHDEEFGLMFRNDDSTMLRAQPLLVTLITKRPPNTLCRPDDDGIDTISRYLHFRGAWEAAIFGTWEGYMDSLTNETYRIKIIPVHKYDGIYDVKIYNLYGEGESCFHTIPDVGDYELFYNQLISLDEIETNWEECGGSDFHRWALGANIKNPSYHSIILEWNEVYNDNTGTRIGIPHTFRGIRIQ